MARRDCLTFLTMDHASARAIATWRYDDPFTVYDGDPDAIPEMIDPRNAFYAIRTAANDLVGFCCFEAAARVPGGDYSLPALDIGLGMRPDLTGHGAGAAFLHAILDFAREQFQPALFRLTVATFNERARRVYERSGFGVESRFMSAGTRQPREFLVMVRRAES